MTGRQLCGVERCHKPLDEKHTYTQPHKSNTNCLTSKEEKHENLDANLSIVAIILKWKKKRDEKHATHFSLLSNPNPENGFRFSSTKK